jgi:RNA polymerase sigma-70 factor (sigma-E family)
MTFEEFALSRLQALLRTATAICGDASLAEDLVQEVLLKVHTHWSRVAASREPDAYVRRMLVNQYLSWRRKWSRFVPTDHVGVAGVEPDVAVRYVDQDHLAGLLAGLPRQQRVVLALRYYADLSDGDIATSMGCSVGTVRGYASRALATLRAAGLADEESPARKGSTG